MTLSHKISIIIPAYNAEKTISGCVNALLHQQGGFSVEVIVVDDGSTDATQSIVKTFESVMLIYQSNAGPAAARNTGIKHASGDFILLTDADCIAHPDWIVRIMESFEEREVSVIAGSYGIANPESLLARCVHREILYRHHRMGEWVNAFGSYNVAFKRYIFGQVGFFDEHYTGASGEDNDLSYRILKAGYRIRFQRQALVDHYHPQLVSRYLKEQFRHGWWRARMYIDHPEQVKGDGYTFWKDAVEVPAVILLSLLAVLTVTGFFSAAMLAGFFILFYLFEFFFGVIIDSDNRDEGFFFAWIMLLRSFARTAGFLTGCAFFALKNKIKI